MQRSRVAAALLALLAVISISVAAATLDRTADGSGGLGAGDTGGTGAGDGRFSIDVSPDGVTPIVSAPGWIVEWLVRLLFLLVVLSALYAGYLLLREHGPRTAAVVAAVGGMFGLLLYWLLGVGGDDAGRNRTGGSNETSLVPGGGVPGGGESSLPAADPPTALAAIFVLALLGAGVVLVRATGDDEFAPEPETVSGDDGDVSAVGRVAGETADRIARGAVADNEIYRAWREMTDHLDVTNPATSTPSEFAAAAVDAGMDPADVTVLTTLFEEVRYGDASVTTDREERAVEALRNIEEGYA